MILGISLAQELPEINLENWFSHPEIVEIRKIYAELQSKIKTGALLELNQTDDCGITKKMLIESGVPKYYSFETGSDDSLLNYEFYYDQNRKLRFAFIKAGATNGTVLEHRIYFKDDTKIWEIQNLVEGPGYTFPEIWPEEFIAYDAAAAFNANCK